MDSTGRGELQKLINFLNHYMYANIIQVESAEKYVTPE